MTGIRNVCVPFATFYKFVTCTIKKSLTTERLLVLGTPNANASACPRVETHYCCCCRRSVRAVLAMKVCRVKVRAGSIGGLRSGASLWEALGVSSLMHHISWDMQLPMIAPYFYPVRCLTARKGLCSLLYHTNCSAHICQLTQWERQGPRTYAWR